MPQDVIAVLMGCIYRHRELGANNCHKNKVLAMLYGTPVVLQKGYSAGQ